MLDECFERNEQQERASYPSSAKRSAVSKIFVFFSLAYGLHLGHWLMMTITDRRTRLNHRYSFFITISYMNEREMIEGRHVVKRRRSGKDGRNRDKRQCLMIGHDEIRGREEEDTIIKSHEEIEVQTMRRSSMNERKGSKQDYTFEECLKIIGN